MKTTVFVLLCLCSWTCWAQDADLDLLRLTRRVPLSTLGDKQIDQINSLSLEPEQMSGTRTYIRPMNEAENERTQKSQQEVIATYRINGNNEKENNKGKTSIRKVTVQLHLDEKAENSSPDDEKDDYDDHSPNQKKDFIRELTNQDDMASSDSNLGASNNDLRYAMPPESFMNNYRHQKELLENKYFLEKISQYASTPGQIHFFSTPTSIPNTPPSAVAEIVSQYQPRSTGNNNVQIIAPPSQNHPYNQQHYRIQNPFLQGSNQQESYVSSPSSSVTKIANQQHHFNYPSQSQNSNAQFVSGPAPSVSYFSTPSPVSRFIEQIQNKPAESIHQYVSTPAPTNIQATIAPNSLYVSTPTHFASTPSPIQYATSSPIYGSRVNNYQNQLNNKPEKQMQIDHFDNAVSGVRSPKHPSEHIAGNVFVSSTTPGPIVLSTVSPINQDKNTLNWKSSLTSIQNYQTHPQSSSNYQVQPTPINSYQSPASPVNNPQQHQVQFSTYQQQQSLSNDFKSNPSLATIYQQQQSSNSFRSPSSGNIVFQQQSASGNNFKTQSQPENIYQSISSQINNNIKSQQQSGNHYQPQSVLANNLKSQQSPNIFQSLSTPVTSYQSPSPSPNSYQSPNSLFNEFKTKDIINQNKNSLFSNNPQQITQKLQTYTRSQSYPSQNIQRETLFSNELDAASQLMLNALHNNYVGERQHLLKSAYQRDINRDTEVAPTNSYNFGWKFGPKRGSVEISPDVSGGDNNVGVYTFSSPSSEQTSTPRTSSQQIMEYRPYPDNPFLNHISFATTSPPLNKGSVQTINFQPDKNEQHNVNVGYSIGFGNRQESKQNGENNVQNLSEKFLFNSNTPTLTTASSSNTLSTHSGDIVKGVQVSQVSVPDEVLLQRYSNDLFTQNGNNVKSVASKQLSFNSASTNKIIHDNSYKASPGSKTSELQPSGKLFQYFINTPVTQPTANIDSSYHGNDESKVQNLKWSSVIGAGVHVSTSPNVEVTKQIVRESNAPNSIIYLNQQESKDLDNNANSFYYPPQKENSFKVMENFDHENAMKNIQPIGLSNVVPPSQLGSNTPLVTIPPQYVNNQPSRNEYHDFTQNIVRAPQNSFTSPQTLESIAQSLSNNYKPYEQHVNKEKLFNYNSYQPYDYLGSESEIRSYIFKNSNSPKQFETSSTSQSDNEHQIHYIIKSASPDSKAQSSNTEIRHIDYTPSETFRHSKNSHPPKNEGSQSPYNRIFTDDQQQKNKDSFDGFDRYANNYFYNQNSVTPKPEINNMVRDSDYQLISTSKRNGEDRFDHDHKSDNKIMTLHGMKIANPYNINLKVLSDLLQGRPAIDDSKFEKYSNLDPIEMDTSMIRELISRNEKIPFELTDDYPHYEHLRSPRRKSVSADLTPINEDSKDYDTKGVSSFDQEDYDESVHNLRTHHAGAVIDQPIGFLPSQRSNDDSSGPELDELNPLTAGSEFIENYADEKPDETIHKPVKTHNEKYYPEKRLPIAPEKPYPLLQPPRLPMTQRSQKKSDRRPVLSLGPRPHHGPIPKGKRDDPNEKKRSISTDLRPPPLLIIKTKTS